MDKKGFTLIELLIVVAIIGIVAAIAIPNLLSALQKGKQKATMGDMKTIGNAIGSYETAFGMFPDGINNAGLGYLEPHFLKRIMKVDGWNFSWHYTFSGNPLPNHYSLGSGGKGGAFSWDHAADYYICISVSDFENDIILSEGMFTYGPRVKN
jgi:prepilin-type N-terminal cleavage/methylation domain-containing protein